MVDVLITEKFFNLLMIASVFSVVLMSIVQKIKILKIIKNSTHIMIGNFILSFLAIPFSIYFYGLNIVDSCWVVLFSFVGAPSIYQLLKKQNVINYTPKSLDDCRECTAIQKENIIERKDGVE